jgi:hypothetical protein
MHKWLEFGNNLTQIANKQFSFNQIFERKIKNNQIQACLVFQRFRNILNLDLLPKPILQIQNKNNS